MKTIALILASLFSFSSFAQTSLTDQLIADFERSKILTLAYIDKMPASEINKMPGEGSRTFSQQMLHLSQGLINLSSNGTDSERPYSQLNLEKDSTLYNKADLNRLATESHDLVIASLKQMNDNNWYEVIERGPFKITRLSWVLKSFEHTNHHRAQCAVYFRVYGLEPPQHQLF